MHISNPTFTKVQVATLPGKVKEFENWEKKVREFYLLKPGKGNFIKLL
jgi:hypothetical protein